MSRNEDYERLLAAYKRLKPEIAQTYPKGWFVGILDDNIVGAAATFCQVETLLREKGIDPRRVLVVEAGVDYPEFVWILFQSLPSVAKVGAGSELTGTTA